MLEELYKAHLEFRRQLWHLIFGLILVYIARFYSDAGYLYVIVGIVGILISYSFRDFWCTNKFTSIILRQVERPTDKCVMPGRQMYLYLIGSGFALVWFQLNFALFGIIILAVGDSITHLIGRFFGKYPWPWNANKNMEGSVFAMILSALAGAIFVPYMMSAFVSILVYIFESIKLPKKYWWVSDNWMIPILGAWLCTIFAGVM